MSGLMGDLLDTSRGDTLNGKVIEEIVHAIEEGGGFPVGRDELETKYGQIELNGGRVGDYLEREAYDNREQLVTDLPHGYEGN